MSILIICYYAIAALAVLSVGIPLIRFDSWIFRIFDYPRLQKLAILIFCMICFLFINHPAPQYSNILFILMAVGVFYLAFLIWPYTLFGQKMIKKDQLLPNEKALNILVSNVYQENRKYEDLIALIQSSQPDIIFLLETDKKWMDAIQVATKQYPFKIEVPLNNTYGLLFYSKLHVVKQEVNYLIDLEIPSIIADVAYNDQIIRLYGIHPTPPVPQENPESTERDAEILMVGRMAKTYNKPCIVFGDLNDVAWSRTTKLFLKSSGLLDARRGRGMFNTFHAKYWFLRWPLDHFFISAHFRLIDMKVEKHISSDHFPISISLVLRNQDKSQAFDISADEKEKVNEKITEGIKEGDAKTQNA
ncbi:endonuclease/exonuclease/phosphatase family protein [Pedobacter sp. AW1-32]|uniref:endonuclease/exonuclease/phosphatase family protein n=1 Tax=Pedobacter sp. AW1-32 TaxID=3383026 RepID=UPI003FF04A58